MCVLQQTVSGYGGEEEEEGLNAAAVAGGGGKIFRAQERRGKWASASSVGTKEKSRWKEEEMGGEGGEGIPAEFSRNEKRGGGKFISPVQEEMRRRSQPVWNA